MTDISTPIKGDLMAGKKGLIMGVANKRSIAWGIVQSLHAQGAEIALTYQGDRLKKRVEKLGADIGVSDDLLLECDVTNDDQIDQVFETLGDKWGELDFIVHAIAFSDKDELEGRYVDTTRDNFARTMDISVYSFTAVMQRAADLMADGGSAITMTYFGGEKVMPHYNVMGVAKSALECSVRYLAEDLGKQNIRVNAVSAGPIKTLAASGIGDFRMMLKFSELNTPLRRNIDKMEVGRTAVYLLSDLGSGVTGETHHVDAGYHATGMIALDNAKEIAELLGEG
jgi:enoyl-[acyl-carrier protein] reductase I